MLLVLFSVSAHVYSMCRVHGEWGINIWWEDKNLVERGSTGGILPGRRRG